MLKAHACETRLNDDADDAIRLANQDGANESA